VIVRASRFILDALIVVVAAGFLAILATGGARFEIAGVPVNGADPRNAVIALYALCLIRFGAMRSGPFLGSRRLETSKLPAFLANVGGRLQAAATTMSHRQGLRLVLALVAVSACIKAANAYFYFGFFSGDDVEIHEMSMAVIHGWSEQRWSPWELRGALYPLGFVFPVQWLAHVLGAESFGLVLTSRLLVIAFSSATIVLVFHIVKRHLGGMGPAVLSAWFLATSALHVRFASSVLPRTVACFFLVAAFGLLFSRRRTMMAPVLAGCLLALGGSLRLSELMFIACALIVTFARMNVRAVIALAGSFTASALLLQGASDWAYWGSPFRSLGALFDYTFVQAASTRGYQPFYYYFSRIGLWATPLTPLVVAAAWKYRSRLWPALVWTAVPITVLSALPHKEGRYLVAVIPFLSIVMGCTVWSILAGVEASSNEPAKPNAERRALVATAAILGILLWELCGFRFPRSEDAVRLAAYVRSRAPSAVAIEQVWRAGGNIYLQSNSRVFSISPFAEDFPPAEKSVLADPGIRYVALRADTSGRSSARATLASSGLAPTDDQPGHPSYVLFERLPPDERD